VEAGAEPILCFDGDSAGERAALRAPTARCRCSAPVTPALRRPALGRDPDTLIGRYGADSMREALDQARPLAEVIWTVEHKSTRWRRPSAAPHSSKRLEAKTRLIADKNVADKYRQFFRERLYATFSAARGVQRRPAGRRDGGRRYPGDRAGNLPFCRFRHRIPIPASWRSGGARRS